ncbi:hypothetical protein W302_02728 [Staphylococcus aureus DAR5885]|nr:hypothetical protein W302_02728 [Staphylococcus aureus DAR5885]
MAFLLLHNYTDFIVLFKDKYDFLNFFRDILTKYVANNETDEKESIYNGKSIAGSVVYFLKVKNKPTVAKLLKYIMIMVTKIVTIA